MTVDATRTYGPDAGPRQRMLAVALVAALVTAMLVPAGSADATPGADDIAFCHATSSAKNPYVIIATDPASIVRRGHTNEAHTGDVFDPAVHSQANGERLWGDVIPPFRYTQKDGSLFVFPGTDNVDDWDAAPSDVTEVCMPGGTIEPEGEVTVMKTAETALTQTHGWNIAKSVDPEELYLYTDGSGDDTVEWQVDVGYLGTTDSAWTVFGTIEVSTDQKARIDSVEDFLGPDLEDAEVSVECEDWADMAEPFVLNVGSELACTYSAELSEAVDGTNTAVVEGIFLDESNADDGAVYADDEADFAFDGDTDVTEVDRYVEVTDTNAGFALAYPGNADGDVILDAHDYDETTQPDSFTYDDEFTYAGQANCTDYQVVNTAKVLDEDAVQLASATATLDVHIQCMVTGSGETATGQGPRWSALRGAPSNWFMYTPIGSFPTRIIAGQHHDIGSASIGGSDMVFELENGWHLSSGSNTVKIEPLASAPTKYIQPGKFRIKATRSGSSFSVPVSGGSWGYAIHLDVRRTIPDPNFGP